MKKLLVVVVVLLALLGVCLAQDSDAAQPAAGDGPHGGETEAEGSPVDDFEKTQTGNEGEGGPDGTGEDPNEPEKISEEEREESLRRDKEGEELDDALDHGLRVEEELYQKYVEYQRELDAEEGQAGESEYVIEVRLEEELHQKEIDDERAESERLQAEERRLREERIRMELRDQEEWESELARGETGESGESGEVDVDGDGNVNDGDSGSTVIRPLWISAFLALLLTIFL